MSDDDGAPLRVLLVTPPITNSGGIGRLVRYELSQADQDPSTHVDPIDSRGDGSPLRSLLRLPSVAAEVRRRCRSGQYDVVHINISTKASTVRKLVLAAAARRAGTPVVLHLHGSGYDEFYRELPRAARARVRRGFRAADAVVVLGRTWQTFVVDELGVAAERVHVVSNAVPGPEPLERVADPDRLRVVFLGEYGSRKGSDLVVEAVAQLHEQGNAVGLELAGNGPAEQAREAVARHGMEAVSTVHGWVSPAEVSQILSRGDVLCLPSRAENQPLVILEAMAHGCVVVASDVGAIPEVVDHGSTGLLLAEISVTALTDALSGTLDPASRSRIANAARAKWASDFTPEAHWRRLRDVWVGASRRSETDGGKR